MPESSALGAIVSDQPHSAIANGFRTLKTNLELAGLGTSYQTLLVTGPAVGEGKSTVALNLAHTLAMGRKRVVLLEGDAYRPQAAYRERRGLSELLLEGGKPTDYLTPTSHPNLSVLPAGLKPAEASGLLDTNNLTRILTALKAAADIVVIDGPPAFVSDALVLAASAEGILVVVRLGQSPWEAATRLRAQFRAASVNVEGIVLNGVPNRPSYQSGYYEQPAKASEQAAWQGAMARIWGGLEGLKSTPRSTPNGGGHGRTSPLWGGAVERIRALRREPSVPAADDPEAEAHEPPR
jgi:capsular exopolysaccharide synthesis family protein